MKMKSCIIGVGMSLLPIVVLAAVPDLTGTAKNVWIEQVKMAVSVPVCKSFTEDESIAVQMKARNINYDRCLALMPAITDKCIQKYEANLPETLNDESAEKWGRIIGECIGNNFAMGYLHSGTNEKPAI